MSHTPNYDPVTECCDPATGNTLSIDDGDACTDDACDPATGQVSHTPNYDPVTKCCDPDTGNTVPIDDGDACTIDTCNPATGRCTHTNICGACCLPDGTCEVWTASECSAIPSADFHGFGTACLGDSNGNGIDDVCEVQIPAVSEWGLMVMTLLLLSGIKIKFGWRQMPQG